MTPETLTTELKGLAGHSDTLTAPRAQNSLTVCLVNPDGKMTLYCTGGAWTRACRLPYFLAIVASGCVDIVVIPEAQISSNDCRVIQNYARTHHCDTLNISSAPTSQYATAMELNEDKQPFKVTASSGILMIMLKCLAVCIEGLTF